MILNEHKPNVETSGQMESTKFSIGNHALLFEILRSKMYSSPIQSICREIMSNAIDSHRERYGNDEKPIQITLPNALDPNYRVKDWGVGISPSRVKDVYTKWGNSTKRDDNLQIGGFGLGSRTPWSYTDSFSVETIVDGIKYSYTCIIDETKIGDCIKMTEVSTDETNGTEIVIPIKSNDFAAFIDGTEFCTRHLKTKPIIKGGKIEWLCPDVILEGTDWKIVKPTYQDPGGSIRLLVDNIQYPLDASQLPNYRDIELLHSTRDTVFLSFRTGELSLSASRESVHLDEPTQAKITKRCEEAYAELKGIVQAKIDACPTYYEANQCYTTIKLSLGRLVEGMTWKKLKLQAELYIPNSTTLKRGGGMSGYSRTYLRFNESKRTIYLDDLFLDKHDHKTLKPLFDTDASMKEALIVYGLGKDNVEKQASLDKIVASHYLNELEAVKLSTAMTLKPKKKVAPRVTVFRFQEYEASVYRSGRYGRRSRIPSNEWGWRRIKYDLIEEDKGIKVLARLDVPDFGVKERWATLNGRFLDSRTLRAILEDKESITLYGLDTTVSDAKIKEHFTGFKTLDDFVKEQFDDKIDFIELRALERLHKDLDSTCHTLLTAVASKIKNKESPIHKYCKEHDLQKALLSVENIVKLRSYEAIHGYIDEEQTEAWLKPRANTKNLSDMQAKILARYPLLWCLDGYRAKDRAADVAKYVNFIDSTAKGAKTAETTETPLDNETADDYNDPDPNRGWH